MEDVCEADCVVLAVAHDEFKALGSVGVAKILSDDGKGIVIDVKGLLEVDELAAHGASIWRL